MSASSPTEGGIDKDSAQPVPSDPSQLESLIKNVENLIDHEAVKAFEAWSAAEAERDTQLSSSAAGNASRPVIESFKDIKHRLMPEGEVTSHHLVSIQAMYISETLEDMYEAKRKSTLQVESDEAMPEFQPRSTASELNRFDERYRTQKERLDQATALRSTEAYRDGAEQYAIAMQQREAEMLRLAEEVESGSNSGSDLSAWTLGLGVAASVGLAAAVAMVIKSNGA